jgi:hypothetical protein
MSPTTPRTRSRPEVWVSWTRVPLLLGIGCVFIGVYIKVRLAEADGVFLLGLGCLLLGVWLATYIAEWARRKGCPDERR